MSASVDGGGSDELGLAFVISAYRLPSQLIRLVELLDGPNTWFVIAVDRRSDATVFDPIRTAMAGRRNVHVLPRRTSPYRSFGHVRSTLRGIDHLLASGVRFDYLSVLTGQDLPIKPPEVIRARLGRADGRGFMEHFTLPTPKWGGGGLNRFSSVFIHTHRHHFQISRRRFGGLIAEGFPFSQVPYGGSGYWTVPVEMVRHVHEFVAANPRFVRFFTTTDMPDETFFHTILMNSPFADRIDVDDLRCIDWSDRAELPKIWRSDDFDRLAGSDALFARKFDETVDAAIIERVVGELVGSGR